MNAQIDLYSQLAALFHLGYRFIKAKNTDKPQWETIGKYQLKSGGFIKDYGSTLFLLGVGFGASTFYTLLDVDINSLYHPANDPKAFQKLLHTLEKKGLTEPVLIQSSHSGGIHIYYFFPKKLHTFRVASLVHVTLINAGFKFKPGHLEIFPNPKPYSTNGKFSNYKPHRLPLQPDSGSYMLDRWGDLVMNAESLTHIGQVAMFLRAAQASAAAHSKDIAKIETALDWAYRLYTDKIAKYQYLDRDYSEAAREWLEDLELTMAIGWTGKGETNQMLQIFVTYGVVFKDLEVKQELFDWVHEAVLITRGYREHCNHQRDIESRIWDWVNATIDNEYYVGYCGFPARRGIGIDKLVKHIKKKERKANAHNQKTADQTQQRLIAILAMLGRLPRLITDRIKAIQTRWQELHDEKVSTVTLYDKKYKSLWHGSLVSVEIADSSTDFTLKLKSLEASLAEPSAKLVIPDNGQQRSTKNTDATTIFHPKILYEVFAIDLTLHCHLQVYFFELFCGAVNNLQSLDSKPELKGDLSDPIDSELITVITSLQSLPTQIIHTTTNSIDKCQELQFTEALEISVRSESSFEIESRIESEPDLESAPDRSIEIGTNLRRNAYQIGGKTYPALSDCRVVSVNGLNWVVRDACGCSWNVSGHALESGIWEIESDKLAVVVDVGTRSVVEIVRQMRMNLAAIPDALLLEFLHHPELDAIIALIELADALAAAETSALVAMLVADLSHSQKLELWGVLSVEERATVETLMARSKSDLSDVVEVEGAVENMLDSSSVGDLVVGATVNTLTGLVGVVKHIFQSMTKPFLVYHQSLGRTILYEGDALRALDRGSNASC
jgi:hypothetical protein